jgi:transglutaminase-like putative cysteine protease
MRHPCLTAVLVSALVAIPVRAEIHGLVLEAPAPERASRSEPSPPAAVYLRRAIGHLTITGQATTETYEAYFHIPVPYREQAILSVDVQSTQLVDYRFVRLAGDNLIVAARLRRAASTGLDWTVYAVIQGNTYADLPSYVPIPTPEQIPDSVRAWLAPTDCAQIEAPIVQNTAKAVRGGITNLIQLANAVCAYCYAIPWTFTHSPVAFDAVYALNWGNSCTGHAHAAAALLRANGVPARVLLNMPTWSGSAFDMHWCIDYFVPAYGWVRLEPSLGLQPYPPQDEIVTFACNPEDEFPLFLPCGIEGNWHTSDPALGTMNPNWAGAHQAYSVNMVSAAPDRIVLAHALTDSAFAGLVRWTGAPLGAADQLHFQTAQSHVAAARSRFIASDLEGFIAELEQGVSEYSQIEPPQPVVVYQEDFESGDGGWTHGGLQDEWEWGTPLDVPQGAYSGVRCWGMDLDDTYENNADCWLLGPWIDLRTCALPQLSFHVWNWVQDLNQGYIHDPLWVEITGDGTIFEPICSQMGGVNDDPAIPDVGGWNRIVLDLSRYSGSQVRLRFHFTSNSSVTEVGSYIDDIEVRGRLGPDPAGADVATCSPPTLQIAPNPFRSLAEVRYRPGAHGPVRLEVFDLRGASVRILAEGVHDARQYGVTWDGLDKAGRPVPAGVYFCRFTGDRVRSGTVVVIR